MKATTKTAISTIITLLLMFAALYFGVVILKGLVGIIIGVIGFIGVLALSYPIIKKHLRDKE